MPWSLAAKFLTILPSFCRLLPHNRITPRTLAQSYKKAQKSYKSRKILPFHFLIQKQCQPIVSQHEARFANNNKREDAQSSSSLSPMFP
ncbi:hypothetical protein CDAR_218781 [Caerostris darwini]|uniref:Secreted protein n=1 Tax=Caerostris darwini TaxID=1538125 RepID=A0AAV4UG80_9ARAC|nr:hypothetical protein CDAR_218781 [Caerostris darwini]